MASQIHTLYQQFQQAYHAQQYEQSLDIIKKIIQLKPNHVETLSNAASAASRAGQRDLAIQYAEQSLAINPDYINSHDILSLNYYYQKDFAKTQFHGNRALTLRDAQVRDTFRLPENVLRQNGQQIIAFSLFGHLPKYVEGAILNAQVAPKWYPDWQCRFYVDDSVAAETCQRLRDLGAEVIEVSDEMKNWVGTVWRFLALDDENVARVIFRDVDSVVSAREAMAVREWVDSGRRFHTIRDGGSHTELILAGLWGAVGGAIDDMTGKLRQYFSQPLVSRHFADQFFLREHIWAYVRADLFAHDRLFGFMNAKLTPEVSDNYDYIANHMGACETSFSHTIPCPFPDGTMMLWRVQTRIAPCLQVDGRPNRQPEMREVCCYRVPVQNSKIDITLPRRYAAGIASGDTIVTIQTENPFQAA